MLLRSLTEIEQTLTLYAHLPQYLAEGSVADLLLALLRLSELALLALNGYADLSSRRGTAVALTSKLVSLLSTDIFGWVRRRAYTHGGN